MALSPWVCLGFPRPTYHSWVLKKLATKNSMTKTPKTNEQKSSEKCQFSLAKGPGNMQVRKTEGC